MKVSSGRLTVTDHSLTRITNWFIINKK